MPKSTNPPASILKALSLPSDPSKTTFSTSGLGGFATTGFIKSLVDNEATGKQEERNFFVKTSPDSKESEEMFRGEYASLNAIADAVPGLCPRALAWGNLGDGGATEKGWFLATEFLELRGSGRSGLSLAKRLGKLHSAPAPQPPTKVSSNAVNVREDVEGQTKPQFGFPVPTFCGDVKQPNKFKTSWPEFYAEQRLMNVLAESEKRNGKDKELRKIVERTAAEVVPRLLGDNHLGYNKSGEGKGIVPVVVHGDLWSGNASKGRIAGSDGGDGEVGDVVYDPSACYAHNEFELGIMKMFGGFGAEFFREYHRIVPKTEPVEEYEDRVSLYELYHELNHTAIFGGSYRSSAMSTMQKLLRTYGGSNH